MLTSIQNVKFKKQAKVDNVYHRFLCFIFIKLSSSSSFNFIYKIINKNYKIALARKTCS